MSSLLGLLLAGLLLLGACRETAEDPLTQGKLAGIVRDEGGQTLDAVQLRLFAAGFERSTQTGSSGAYLFEQIPAGSYSLEIKHPFYAEQTFPVQITAQVVQTLDLQLQAESGTLTLEESFLRLPVFAGQEEMRLEASGAWVASSDSPWLRLLSPSGSGNAPVRMQFDANAGEEPRQARILISSGATQVTLELEQPAPVRVAVGQLDYGDESQERPAGFWLQFTAAVEVEEIRALHTGCIPTFVPWTTSEDQRALFYSYGCAGIGGSYAFVVDYSDEFGNRYQENVEARFYEEVLPFEGVIVNTKTDPIQDKQWVLTRDPATVQLLDFTRMEVEKKFSFSLQPGEEVYDLAFNPFNGLLYVSTQRGLRLFNPGSGQQVQEVLLPETGFMEGVRFFAVALAIDAAGNGLLSVEAPGTDFEGWLFMETQGGHRVFPHPAQEDAQRFIAQLRFPQVRPGGKGFFAYGTGGGQRGLLALGGAAEMPQVLAPFEEEPDPFWMLVDRLTETVLIRHSGLTSWKQGQGRSLGFPPFAPGAVAYCTACPEEGTWLLANGSVGRVQGFRGQNEAPLPQHRMGGGAWLQTTALKEPGYYIVRTDAYSSSGSGFQGQLLKIAYPARQHP
ncbi:MAG: carboxypeptidase regulatory-like domain-containing protein [Nitritalea sp.]